MAGILSCDACKFSCMLFTVIGRGIKKTEKKTYTRKKQNGGVVEETTTTKSETMQQRPQPVK